MGIKDLGQKKTNLVSNFKISSSKALKHSPMPRKEWEILPRTTGPVLVPKSQP